MLSADSIIALHDRQIDVWHREPAEPRVASSFHTRGKDGAEPASVRAWLDLVTQQHRANFDLWHIEDEARIPGATDAQVAGVKRRIDLTNQLRNDLVEELDRALLTWLELRGLPKDGAPLNSESPGLIIDRLSILALKICHTREEAARAGAPPGHAQRNRERLSILEEQRADLATSLDALWRETLAGTRRFKLYRQLKMYNDPFLNPAIYGSSAQ